MWSCFLWLHKKSKKYCTSCNFSPVNLWFGLKFKIVLASKNKEKPWVGQHEHKWTATSTNDRIPSPHATSFTGPLRHQHGTVSERLNFWIRIKQQSNGVHTGTGSRGIRFVTKPQTLRVPYIDRALFDFSLKQQPDNVQPSTGSRGQCHGSWGCDKSIAFHASFTFCDSCTTTGILVVLDYLLHVKNSSHCRFLCLVCKLLLL